MRAISAGTDIDATPAQVWAVLTDFAAYGRWNPFIREAAGELKVGARLELRMFPQQGKAMTFRPRVLAVEPERELRWIGHLLVPGVFDGEHRFELSALASGGTRLVQSERFRGALVPFVGKVVSNTERDFGALNAALKEHVESAA